MVVSYGKLSQMVFCRHNINFSLELKEKYRTYKNLYKEVVLSISIFILCVTPKQILKYLIYFLVVVQNFAH